MHRTFNCGIGMVLVVAPRARPRAPSTLLGHGVPAWEIGTIVARAGGAPRRPSVDLRTCRQSGRPVPMKSAVILISGRGSNMQALVEAKPGLDFRAVISNRPGGQGPRVGRVAGHRDARRGPQGLRLARGVRCRPGAGHRRLRARLPLPRGLHAHPHRGLHRPLPAPHPEHPSLAPARRSRACDTHRRALEAGVKLHGATVHFVTPALDHGPILVQAAVPVLAGDTEETLAGARAGAGAPHLSAGGALARRGARGIRGPPMSSRCAGSGVATDWAIAPRDPP